MALEPRYAFQLDDMNYWTALCHIYDPALPDIDGCILEHPDYSDYLYIVLRVSLKHI